METITISKTYTINRWLTEYICYTECRRVINNKTGKEVKQFLRGNQSAIYIDGAAHNIKDIKPFIRDVKCPF